jgi:hypothetical protein
MEVRYENIAGRLEAYTEANSNFDISRPYVSLSHIADDEDVIIDNYFKGFSDTKEIRLRCYKGYQMERDLLARMAAVFGDKIKTGIEFVSHDCLVKIHPDFTYLEYPGDCKSVTLDDWLPVPGKLPRKVYWQLQAQMLYAGKPWGLAVYESRESGKIIDFWVRENNNIQQEIKLKIDRIVTKIRQRSQVHAATAHNGHACNQ